MKWLSEIGGRGHDANQSAKGHVEIRHGGTPKGPGRGFGVFIGFGIRA